MYEVVKPFGSGHFFLGLGLDLILYFDDVPEMMVELSTSLTIFFMGLGEVVEEVGSGRIKLESE